MVMKNGEEYVETTRGLKACDLYLVLNNSLTVPLNEKGDRKADESFL